MDLIPTAEPKARVMPSGERWLWTSLWASAGVIMCGGIAVLGEGTSMIWALAPAAVTFFGVREVWSKTMVTTPPLRQRLRALREQWLAPEARGIVGTILAGAAFWAIVSFQDLRGSVALWGLGLIGTVLAWEVSLGVAVCGGLWWAWHNWHLSTPSAVIVGAIIVALAIASRR